MQVIENPSRRHRTGSTTLPGAAEFWLVLAGIKRWVNLPEVCWCRRGDDGIEREQGMVFDE